VPVVPFPGQEATPGPLADPNLEPLERLDVVRRQLSRARAEWEAAVVAEDAAEEYDAPPELLDKARAEVRATYARWSTIADQADELARDARRSQPLEQSYEKAYKATLKELQEQFDGGPHYDLLCERVAGLHVRLKRMEASPHEYPAPDHARLNQQLLGYINQLQRYTEAMKTESISREAQGVAEKILLIVEKHLATSYPELWRGVMHEVRSALESVAA
jgi:hypothetical protein